MATNRDLLAEAIADAKTVKETAIANAKAALEEAFTPHLTQMLSAKLQEMEEDTIKEDEEYMETETEDELNEVSLDELLAELEEGDNTEIYEAKKKEEDEESEGEEGEESEEMSIEDMGEDDLKSFIEDVIKDMVAAGELEAGHEGMENEEGAEEAGEDEDEESGEESEEEFEEEEIDEEINLEELLEEETIEDEMSLEELLAELEKVDEEYPSDTNESSKTEELEEAMATIAILKKDLNEINLLNAKLLYTNKIFRSKSLTESQKVKVLTAFDKATTKKEVELVYETLSEGLKVSTISTKSPIKESLGSASRALGSAVSKPIIENDAFSRMRELAGLKK